MKHLFLLLCCMAFVMPAQAQEEGFPGRITYPRIAVYETDQLNQSFADVTVVDVRSRYEFETLHINNAINIPLNSMSFIQEITELQNAMGKPIVFYCNGHSCYKSYKACTKAISAGIRDVFAYDSGIFDWARAHPEKATMLGKTPVDTTRLISKSELKKYLLDPKQFTDRINDKAVILDIREPKQRGLIELFPYRQENISMDDKTRLNTFLNKIKASGKTLLVYDEAGKQVRWFQYYLVEKGIKNYYFMTGGVKRFFKDLRS